MIQTNAKHLLPECYYANLYSQFKKKRNSMEIEIQNEIETMEIGYLVFYV